MARETPQNTCPFQAKKLTQTANDKTVWVNYIFNMFTPFEESCVRKGMRDFLSYIAKEGFTG
jgi:hypothetical protein